MGVKISCHGKREFWDLSSPLINIGSLCSGVRSKRDHSVLDNGKTAGLLQPNAMFPISRCHITLYFVKNVSPLRCDFS